jgi:hypothetical protein
LRPYGVAALGKKKGPICRSAPLVQFSINASIKSEQILGGVNVKVKRVGRPLTQEDVITARHEAATLGSLERGNLRLLEQREKLRAEQLRKDGILSTPSPVRENGFTTYAKRLERTARGLDATHDDAQAAAGGVDLAALGNNTLSRAGIRWFLDEKTGEYQRHTVDSKRGEYVAETAPEFVSINARAARFSVQSTAAKLLHAELTPRGTQWRVTGCTRRKVAAEVSILYSAEIKKAHFGGLMVCGSVWTCPPCAAKVSERRKTEVVNATNVHKAAGGGLYMVTLTTSHSRQDDLGDWLSKYSKARQDMRRQRAYRELMEFVGYSGDIVALEVTYGDANGWHPHSHELQLLASTLSARKLEHMTAELFRLWHRSCVKVGLPLPNRKRGVTVIAMESAAEYIAKFGREPHWGVGSELAKQHIKKGRNKGWSPFDLLRLYHEGSVDGSHKRFGQLFVQFANCFFLKRQLRWSPGLKQAFGIEEKTDEAVAVEEAEDARELARLTPEHWRVVLAQKYDVRQILLERAETGGYDAVVKYIETLCAAGGVFGPFMDSLSPSVGHMAIDRT